MKKPQQKARPIRVWAHVNKKTGQIVNICKYRSLKKYAIIGCLPTERLARVEIKEI